MCVGFPDSCDTNRLYLEKNSNYLRCTSFRCVAKDPICNAPYTMCDTHIKATRPIAYYPFISETACTFHFSFSFPHSTLISLNPLPPSLSRFSSSFSLLPSTRKKNPDFSSPLIKRNFSLRKKATIHAKKQKLIKLRFMRRTNRRRLFFTGNFCDSKKRTKNKHET